MINNTVIKELKRAVKGMDYGTILIEVHDGKVVQVEAAPGKKFAVVMKFNEGEGI